MLWCVIDSPHRLFTIISTPPGLSIHHCDHFHRPRFVGLVSSSPANTLTARANILRWPAQRPRVGRAPQNQIQLPLIQPPPAAVRELLRQFTVLGAPTALCTVHCGPLCRPRGRLGRLVRLGRLGRLGQRGQSGAVWSLDNHLKCLLIVHSRMYCIQ